MAASPDVATVAGPRPAALAALWARRHGLAAAVPSFFRVDTRALAAMRIGLGLILLGDLALRSSAMIAFYTDAGAVPRSLVLERYPWAVVSLNMLSGSLAWQVVLFLVSAVAAAALVLGYRTRAATIASFVLLASLQARVPWVLNAGDTTLALLLFWSMFLPLGAHWSLDRRGGPRHVADAASAGLLIQVVLIYLVNAVFKARAGPWWSGQALHFVMVDQFAAPVGLLLARAPAGLLSLLGWAWFGLVCASFLLLALRGRWRGAMAAAFIAGHLAMMVTMRLGLFPLTSTMALLPFLPGPVWDAVARRWPGRSDAKESGRRRRPHDARLRQLRTGVLVLGIVVMVSWGTATLGLLGVPGTEDVVERNRGGWAMFADPRDEQVWYVALGRTSDGNDVDALSGGPPPWDAPPALGPYPDSRWRKFQEKLANVDGPLLQPQLLSYLCQRWNAHHDRVDEMTLVRVVKPITDDGSDAPSRTINQTSVRCP